MTTMHKVHGSDGVSVAAYDFGGQGPPLLLAHATGFHAHVLVPMIELLRSSFHCYAIDERGHGASSVPTNGNFDWRHSAADVLAVRDHFGLEQPYGFGHSCGGALLLLAEQDHPGSWRAAYTYEPVVPPPDLLGPAPDGPEHQAEAMAAALADNPLAAGALRRRTDFPSRGDAFANFATKPHLSALAPAALWAYVEHGFIDQPDGRVTLACRPASEATTYVTAAWHRAWDRLGEVSCPVTVAGGADSTHFAPDANRAVAERLPRGRPEILVGLGHFGPLEDPALVAASVADALLA